MLKKIFFAIFFIFSCNVLAQDLNAHSPKPAPVSRQQQAADKMKLKQQQKIQEEIELGQKRHIDLQAKNTKKMMKKSQRSAKRWNESRKEFFLKRWFTKKHH